MANEAAEIVYQNTQQLIGVNTHPSNVMQHILEREGNRLSKPDIAVETGLAIRRITSPNPIFSYEEDEAHENELFSKISVATNEIRLPSKIIIERSMYLRDKPSKSEGWFSYKQHLKDRGYERDFGGIHEVNYVIARLTGFHILQREKGSKKGRLMYSKGRDILLSTLFISEAEVFKNNKSILDDILL